MYSQPYLHINYIINGGEVLLSIVPLVSYSNVATQKEIIIKDNKRKSGVFC